MELTGLFYILFACWLALCLAATIQLYFFLQSHQAISTYNDMSDFKGLARLQMYGALLSIVLGGSFFLLGIYLLLASKVGLLVILLLNGVIFFLSLYTKKLENRAKSLPVPNDSLKDEYTRVIDVWMHKPFPDF